MIFIPPERQKGITKYKPFIDPVKIEEEIQAKRIEEVVSSFKQDTGVKEWVFDGLLKSANYVKNQKGILLDMVRGIIQAADIVITGGSIGWSNVLDDDGNLPDNNADVTSANTAANIAGQGDLATTNEADANVLNMQNAPADAGADVTADNETFSANSDINALQTTNAPSEAGADVTSAHPRQWMAHATPVNISATDSFVQITAQNTTNPLYLYLIVRRDGGTDVNVYRYDKTDTGIYKYAGVSLDVDGGTPAFTQALGISVDDSGQVYIIGQRADNSTIKIYRYDADLGSETEITFNGGITEYAGHMCFDGTFLYVVRTRQASALGDGTIEKFTITGTTISAQSNIADTPNANGFWSDGTFLWSIAVDGGVKRTALDGTGDATQNNFLTDSDTDIESVIGIFGIQTDIMSCYYLRVSQGGVSTDFTTKLIFETLIKP